MKTKEIAISSILASLYVIIGYILPLGIMFGQINFRLQDCLYALIPLFGESGLIGTFLGHLLFNLYGFSMGYALGLLDLLSPFIFLLPKYLLWKKGLKALPIHVLFVALWIGFLLERVVGVPLLIGIISVGIGESICEGLGIILYYGIRNKITIKNS